MAGGKGTRMRHTLEKPLIPIGGRPMIERVLNAVQRSKKVDDIIVMVSPNTPATAERMKNVNGIKLIETSGGGYIQDMKHVIKSERLKIVLVISADLPLITPELIDKVIIEYERCGKSALMVAVTLAFCERQGFYSNSAYSGRYGSIIPAGINVIDGARIDEEELEEEVLVLNRTEIAANINSLEDLERIREIIGERETRETTRG
jgi:adenosylcobinamide-phosphate guanylyltransferase